jgi:hypothetical protein
VPRQFVEEAVDVLDVARMPAGEFEHPNARRGHRQIVHHCGFELGRLGPLYGEYRDAERSQSLQRVGVVPERPEDREYLSVADPHRPQWQRLEVVAGLAQAGPDEEIFEVTDGDLPA